MTDPRPLVIGGWLAGQDGVGYYRMRLPLDELERRGHSVEYRGMLPWRAGKRPAHHVLVAQRISNPGPSAQWQAARGDVRRLFELDDDLLNVDPTSERARAYYNDPQIRARLVANVRSADAVTVSTEYLARVVRDEYGVTAPIHVLPNCLPRSWVALEPVDQTGAVRIGWAGSDTHRGDFEVARKPLARFFRRHPDVPFDCMGAEYGHLVAADDQGRSLPWRPIWADPLAYYRSLDWQIGLAPLANHQFNRAKSALKALEYAARGIVVIASDVEPYRHFVRHGETGFLVQRDHEWGDYLEALLSDEGLRVKLSVAAREQAAEWTIDRHIHLWEEAYRD